MLPPGLSFVAAQESALASDGNGSVAIAYYFHLLRDFAKEWPRDKPFIRSFPDFRFGRSAAADPQEGLEKVSCPPPECPVTWSVAVFQALGLPLYVDEKWASPTLTAVGFIDSFDVEGFRRTVSQECGVARRRTRCHP